MATAQDIVQDALEMLGIYAAGETMSDADAGRGLSVLNDMLDSWSNESLTCFAITEQSAALVVGTSAYTIGSGGTFNMTRPLRLIEGPGAAYTLDSGGNKYQMNVVPQDQWNLITNTSSTQTSNFPNTLFYDPQFPLGTLHFFPTPNASYTAYWDSYLQLVTLTSLSTAVSLPPGYKRALGTNLAVAIKPYFTAAQIDPAVIKEALESKGNIKRTNIRTVQSRYDPEIVGKPGLYSIYTDGYTPRA